MSSSVHSAPPIQQASRHPSFPAVSSTAATAQSNSRSGSSMLPSPLGPHSADPSQSLSQLLSAMSASASASLPPAAPPSSSSPSAAGPATAPSLFSSYLLAVLHVTLSDLRTVLSLSAASLDDPQLAGQPALLIGLKEQLQLEHHYGLLLQAWRDMAEGDEGWAEQRRAVEEQYSCIVDSTRSLLRLVPKPQLSPPGPSQPHSRDVSGGSGAAAAAGSQHAFYSLFSHLVALMTTRLHLSAKESDKQQHTLHALTTQHGHDTQTLHQLSQQLSAARAQHGTSLAQQHALLGKYQAALTNLLDGAEEEALNFSRRMKADEEENQALFDGRQSELGDEERRRRAEGVEQGGADEWAREEAMRRKVAIKHDDVARVVAQYDAEMEWEERVYTELSTLYEREREESRRLAVFFERVKERDRKEAEELDRLRARRDEELRRDRESAESVRVLEQLFDGWMRRNGPKEKKKAADKKKPYKTMWRPVVVGQDSVIDVALEESKETVTEAAAE